MCCNFYVHLQISLKFGMIINQFVDIIATAVFHNDANETSKCFI